MAIIRAMLEVDKGQSQRYLHRPINQGSSGGNSSGRERGSFARFGGRRQFPLKSQSLFKNCRSQIRPHFSNGAIAVQSGRRDGRTVV